MNVHVRLMEKITYLKSILAENLKKEITYRA
jgi:hypothetical protein